MKKLKTKKAKVRDLTIMDLASVSMAYLAMGKVMPRKMFDTLHKMSHTKDGKPRL